MRVAGVCFRSHTAGQGEFKSETGKTKESGGEDGFVSSDLLSSLITLSRFIRRLLMRTKCRNTNPAPLQKKETGGKEVEQWFSV